MASNGRIISRWLEAEPSDEDDLPNGDCSDVEFDVGDDFVLEEVRGSDSEIDGEEESFLVQENAPQITPPILSSSDEEVPLDRLRSNRPRKKNYFGKNRFRWSSLPPSSRTRTLQHNIVQQREGVKPPYRDVLNSCWTAYETTHGA